MKVLSKLNYKHMNEENEEVPEVTPEVTPEVVAEVQETASRFNCANCEDSGKECYVCGAGRQVV